MHARPWLWYGIFLLLVLLALSGLVCHAQVIELDCPTGTLPISPFSTRNPATQGTKRNVCVDGNGNMIFQGYQQPTLAEINPLAYGVRANTQYVSDATTSSGSATVTCPNNDCNFTSADVGKIAFATNSYISPATLVCPDTTISTVNSPQSVTLAATCTANQTANAYFVWGTDDTAALQAAWNAMVTRGSGILKLPAGGMLVSKGIGTAAATTPMYEWGVAGVAPYSSVLIIRPSFDTTTCNFGGVRVCFFGGLNDPTTLKQYFANFTIWGVGQTSANGVTNPASLTYGLYSPGGNGVEIYGVILFGWYGTATASNFIGFHSGQWMNAVELQVYSFGGLAGLDISGCCNTMHAVYTEGQAIGLRVNSGGTVASHGGYYLNAGGGNNAITNNGTFNSFGDTINGGGGSTGTVINTGTLNIFGSNLTGQVTTPGGIITQSAGSTAISGSVVNNTWSTNAYALVLSGGTFADLGGNTITGTTGKASISGSTAVTQNGSITGVSQTVPNIVLGGNWGTSPSITVVTGFTKKEQFTINVGSGTPGANPTVTVTFPTAFYATPACRLVQVGGTQVALALQFTTGTVTTTTAAFTYNGTPTASASIVVQMDCDLP